MEGLNFEKGTSEAPKRYIRPMKEVPILNQEEKEKILAKIRDDKSKNIRENPHWEDINPDSLEDIDIYSYYRTFEDELEPWSSEECEDFINYEEKVKKYLTETYEKGDIKVKLKDSRNNLYGLIRNYLMVKGAWEERQKKIKDRTIQ